MAISSGIFGDGSNFEQRNLANYEVVAESVQLLKALGLKIVLTAGSFDLIHEGHAQYLERARQFGDLLITGVDSDDKIRHRKGPDRPIVPQAERLRMLTHLRHVDLVVLKPLEAEKWALIKAVRPDVLVATEETYTQDQITELERLYCGRVEVLPRMATTTTSARLRLLQLNLADRMTSRLANQLPDIVRQVIRDQIEGR
ncbi:MAG TPA: adenylyltransferase/cytidyltransferase family protein [Candidatus Saccharimonas sp.]|nr:adenylyltransferase/cytidyltransferase family protein [Candidatus Saccharimonas sp.]